MKTYVKYVSEMDKTPAYPSYLEITNELRKIMKLEHDLEYYAESVDSVLGKYHMIQGLCNEIERSLSAVIYNMQHLDRETRDYISGMERSYSGFDQMEDTV